MTQYQTGADALAALTATNESGGSGMEFTSFKSGSNFKVRVMGAADLITFRSYGIYKQISSFVAKTPSVYSAKGFPESNLTPWDKASEYYSKLAFDAEGDADKQKELRTEASKYRGKQRFALGFIDLDTGTPIIIDLSKKQAQAVHTVIKKNEKKLGTKAFELEKTGSDTSTQVIMSPLDLDDLTDKQQAKFAEWDGKAFDPQLFEGLLYEADETEQLRLLTQAGFNNALIGYGDATPTQIETGDKIPDEEELPF